MIELLASLFSSAIGGGLIGVVSAAVQRVGDYKNKQLDVELTKAKMGQEITLKKIDLEIIDKELANRLELANIEAMDKEAARDAAIFNKNLFSEPERYSKGNSKALFYLDFIRGLVRPALTIYVCAFLTMVYLHLRQVVPMDAEAQSAIQLQKHVIETVTFITTSVVLHWFGTRNKAPAPRIK